MCIKGAITVTRTPVVLWTVCILNCNMIKLVTDVKMHMWVFVWTPYIVIRAIMGDSYNRVCEIILNCYNVKNSVNKSCVFLICVSQVIINYGKNNVCIKSIVLCKKCLVFLLWIPSFRLRDNSVHLHECSPFWIGIFITFNTENYHVYCFM